MTGRIERWRKLRTYRSIMRELKALSPRELRALGIERSDLARLARAAAGL